MIVFYYRCRLSRDNCCLFHTNKLHFLTVLQENTRNCYQRELKTWEHEIIKKMLHEVLLPYWPLTLISFGQAN